MCRFCGRGVCKQHHKEKPFVLSVYLGIDQTPLVLAVDNVLACDTCRPMPRPVRMPELAAGIEN